MRSLQLLVMALSFLWVVTSGGHTVAASTQAPAEAEAHLQKGLELRRLNRDAEALEEFQKALALQPSARAEAQVGLAQMAVGQFEAAERNLTEVLSYASDPWIVEHRSTLADALDKIQSHLGTLSVSGDPVGARVEVNGKTVGSLPCLLHVQAGDTAVRVVAPGYLPILRTVQVEARQRSNEVFTLVKISSERVSGSEAPSPIQNRSEPSQGAARSPWPWIVGGGSVGALAFGAIESARWATKASDFNNKKDAQGRACGTGETNSGGSGCSELLHDGHQARALALGGFVVGVALGVTSMILFFHQPGEEAQQALACGPAGPSASIACSVKF